MGEIVEDNGKMFWEEMKLAMKIFFNESNSGRLIAGGRCDKQWADYFDKILNVENLKVVDIVVV